MQGQRLQLLEVPSDELHGGRERGAAQQPGHLQHRGHAARVVVGSRGVGARIEVRADDHPRPRRVRPVPGRQHVVELGAAPLEELALDPEARRAQLQRDVVLRVPQRLRRRDRMPHHRQRPHVRLEPGTVRPRNGRRGAAGGGVWHMVRLFLHYCAPTSEDSMSARALVVATIVVLAGCAKPQPSGQASAAGDTSGTHGLPMMQQRLLEAANIALPPGVAPESLPEPASAGREDRSDPVLHAMSRPAISRHARSHRLDDRGAPDVGAHRHDGGRPRHPDAQHRRARRCCSRISRRTRSRSPSQPPAGAGEARLQRTCSRCHALADPKMHSAPDWPVVVMRMEKNMEKMQVSGVSRAAGRADRHLPPGGVEPAR